MEYKKKLIEVALPLEAINTASAREKSIRHGHPSTLHLWWARRPLAAARAVIWSSLVDDPSSLPDEFPTEEEQTKERERLFGILERLVKWENTNNQEVLDEAKAEIMKSTGGNPPPLLDPFAGGGAIPLEAQRLGLEAHASDLNPVAVMINKAMIEIPPKFLGQPPVNPEAKSRNDYNSEWPGATGLAEDVRYYGEWMKNEAFKKIGHLYPKVKDEHGKERTVIAWIWTRTVKCPNPACGCEMPLASTFVLSKKKGKEAYIQPIVEGNKIRYEVKYGKNAPKAPKIGRGANFKCICCGSPADGTYIKSEGIAKRLSKQLMAIVAEGDREQLYFSVDRKHYEMSSAAQADWVPEGDMFGKAADQLPLYGYKSFSELFTKRQLTALTTFSDYLKTTLEYIKEDTNNTTYAEAIAVYLAFAIDRQANYSSMVNTWAGFITQTFGRQAIPMTWDFAETNIFSNSSGNWSGAINWIVRCFNIFPGANEYGNAVQHDAQTDNGLRGVMISTDPPYYDNICYGDLSDFFYIWLRRNLKEIYPSLFHTMLVPKSEELIASHYRFDGNRQKAKLYFEESMFSAFEQINKYTDNSVPTTIYYAYKQAEEDENSNITSSGWETMLSAVIQAGFLITGTWPIHTERETGLKNSVNALASSIVLVCRKRSADAPISTRRDFINALKRELKPALKKLQASNIAPVDLAQSAIGPGMGVYSRFSKVLEADGSLMSVRSALQIINQELDLFFSEQDGELDSDSRFCIDLYTQYAFNDVKFGEADVLARAKNTSVEKLAGRGILYAEKGIVRLLPREEVTKEIGREKTIWLLTQQLTYALEKDGVLGVAKIVADIYTSEPEHAKALAYRLFQLAERKGWAQEALAYNSLVIAWPEIQSKAAELNAAGRVAEQIDMFEID